MTSSTTHYWRWAIAVLGFMLLLTACGVLDSDDSADTASAEFAEDSDHMSDDGGDMADEGDDMADGDYSYGDGDDMGDDMVEDSAASGGDGLAVPEISPISIGRQIIYTAEIEIRVEDVLGATAAANEAIAQVGGFLFGQSTVAGSRPHTVLTYKVYPEDFDRAMRALEGVGTVEHQSIYTDDVTERVVDLESRITTAELSVERVRTLISSASDVKGIVELEQQLLERETILEQLKGRLRTLQNQVSLATITVTITEQRPDIPLADIDLVAWLGEDEDDACPGFSHLTMEANDEAVLCIEVRNTGDDVLTDVDINVPTFRLRIDDLTVRSGDLSEIEPGGSVVAVADIRTEDGFVHRINASRGRDIEVVATAVPAASLWPQNQEVELEVRDFVYLEASVEDPLPGFSDSFSSGWSKLATLGSVLLIVFGTVLPFLPFVAVAAWLILRRFRRRSAEPFYPDEPDADDSAGTDESDD
ncbi:MAG: DUF4349 domain-containing protein [Acidimicrobiaceae bacterium]|nr:DUF4349 domain-containing protein [Acidimicrobiaceae bacterium]MYC43407.1 DUF4349 domain-containing protein [Acidimicrobiaceae bacterium]